MSNTQSAVNNSYMVITDKILLNSNLFHLLKVPIVFLATLIAFVINKGFYILY